jgi:hypothetical protein
MTPRRRYALPPPTGDPPAELWQGTCPRCGGRGVTFLGGDDGEDQVRVPCLVCGGSGYGEEPFTEGRPPAGDRVHLGET